MIIAVATLRKMAALAGESRYFCRLGVLWPLRYIFLQDVPELLLRPPVADAHVILVGICGTETVTSPFALSTLTKPRLPHSHSKRKVVRECHHRLG